MSLESSNPPNDLQFTISYNYNLARKYRNSLKYNEELDYHMKVFHVILPRIEKVRHLSLSLQSILSLIDHLVSSQGCSFIYILNTVISVGSTFLRNSSSKIQYPPPRSSPSSTFHTSSPCTMHSARCTVHDVYSLNGFVIIVSDFRL